MVRHRNTGWLARPFDAADFATGLRWVLADSDLHAALREAARADAVARFLGAGRCRGARGAVSVFVTDAPMPPACTPRQSPEGQLPLVK